MERCNYIIKYVMPNGFRVGLYKIIEGSELKQVIESLKDKGYKIEAVEKKDQDKQKH